LEEAHAELEPFLPLLGHEAFLLDFFFCLLSFTFAYCRVLLFAVVKAVPVSSLLLASTLWGFSINTLPSFPFSVYLSVMNSFKKTQSSLTHLKS
jgi:hypothetical protein